MREQTECSAWRCPGTHACARGAMGPTMGPGVQGQEGLRRQRIVQHPPSLPCPQPRKCPHCPHRHCAHVGTPNPPHPPPRAHPRVQTPPLSTQRCVCEGGGGSVASSPTHCAGRGTPIPSTPRGTKGHPHVSSSPPRTPHPRTPSPAVPAAIASAAQECGGPAAAVRGPDPPPAPPSQPPSHRGPSHARAPPSHGALRGGHLLHERRGRNVQTSQPPVVKRADLHTHVGGRRAGVCTLTPWGVFAHSHLGVYLHTHNTHRGAFAHSPSTSPHTCALCTQG